MIPEALEEIQSMETSHITYEAPNLKYANRKSGCISKSSFSQKYLAGLAERQRFTKPRTPADYWKKIDDEYQSWIKKYRDIFTNEFLWEMNLQEFEDFLLSETEKTEESSANCTPEYIKIKSSEQINNRIDIELPITSFLPMNSEENVLAVILKINKLIFHLKFALKTKIVAHGIEQTLLDDSIEKLPLESTAINQNSRVDSKNSPEFELLSFQATNPLFWNDIREQNHFLETIQSYMKSDGPFLNPLNLEILSLGNLILNSSNQKELQRIWSKLKNEMLTDKQKDRTNELIELQKK